MTIDELRALIRECADQMRALVTAAESDETRDDGALTEPEAADFATLERWIEQADEKIKRLEAIDVAAERGGVPPEPSAPNINRNVDPFDMSQIRFNAPGSEIRAQAVTAIESMQAPDAVRSKLTDVIERNDTRRGDLARHALVTGSPVYREAFRAMLAGEALTAEQNASVGEARAAIGTGTGFTAPITIDPTVLHIGDGSSNPYRQVANVRTVINGQDSVNTLASAAFSFDAEGAEVSDDTPADSTVTIPVHKAQGSVLYTLESAQDFVGLEADLIEAISMGKDDAEATIFTTGSGTGNNPEGVVTALAGSASEVDTATTATFVLGDVYALRNALPPRYRPNASWVAEQAIYSDIRQFDTAGGAGLWTTLGNGDPDQLIGKSAYEASAMDNDSTNSGDEILIYGDFYRGFRIVDRIGLTVEPFMHTGTTANLPNGTKGLFCYWRVGSGVTNVNALRMLQVAA